MGEWNCCFFSTTPVDMEGRSNFIHQENGSFTPWSEVFNTTVNGSFALQFNLNASLANAPAGEMNSN